MALERLHLFSGALGEIWAKVPTPNCAFIVKPFPYPTPHQGCQSISTLRAFHHRQWLGPAAPVFKTVNMTASRRLRPHA